MRPLFLVVIAIFATGTLLAQNSIEQFMEQYAEVEHINKLSLQGSLLNLVANLEDDKKERKAIAKLDKLSALWIEDYNPISKKAIRQLVKNIEKERFEPLVVVKNGDSNVNFYLQENGDRITGVILLIDDEDNFLLVNLVGNLRFEDLGAMDLEVEGMENFKKLPKNRAELKRA